MVVAVLILVMVVSDDRGNGDFPFVLELQSLMIKSQKVASLSKTELQSLVSFIINS